MMLILIQLCISLSLRDRSLVDNITTYPQVILSTAYASFYKQSIPELLSLFYSMILLTVIKKQTGFYGLLTYSSKLRYGL